MGVVVAGLVVELAGARLVAGHFAVSKQNESAQRRRQVGPGAAKPGDGNVQLPFTVNASCTSPDASVLAAEWSQPVQLCAPASFSMHLTALLTSLHLLPVCPYTHLLPADYSFK